MGFVACHRLLWQGAVEGSDQNHLDGSDANQRIAQVPVDVIRQELLTWKVWGLPSGKRANITMERSTIFNG
jgi:hypothetical protein